MSSPNTKQLMEMYREYGLSEPFARAIVEGKDPKVVMEFWNQDWHKQYPDADDALVIAVLEQTITPEEGEWLNSVRSNHEALVLSCLDGSCTIEWAKSLMDAGFLNHSKEVIDILKGGDPIVIGMLSGIKLESDLLPPKLEVKVASRGTVPVKRITCRNCSRIIEAQPKCPHCEFRLLWEWDSLSVQEKEMVVDFMRDYFPEVTYENVEALKLMEIISRLDIDSLKRKQKEATKKGKSPPEGTPGLFWILSNEIHREQESWIDSTYKSNQSFRPHQFQKAIMKSIRFKMARGEAMDPFIESLYLDEFLSDLIADSTFPQERRF